MSCNVVWQHHMLYQKVKNAQELNMNPITVDYWTRNTQGVLRFIEVGEGVSKGPVMENAEAAEDDRNSLIENEAENQLIENLEEHVEHSNETEAKPAPPTTNVMTASGRVCQPPVQLIEEMGKAALAAAE